MKLRDFLPGEPVVDDIILCIDGKFDATTRAQKRELPEKGRLYKVRSIMDHHHSEWGFHDVVRVNGQDDSGDFNRKLHGLFPILRFKATHEPQADWSKDPYINAVCDDPDENFEPDKVHLLFWKARQCPAWRQLCHSNLGLALALATLHPWETDDAAASQATLTSASSMRRLDICRMLGFPATSHVLRLLSRLHPSWGHAFDTVWLQGMLMALRQLLTHESHAAELLLRHDEISRNDFKRLAFGPRNIGLSDLFEGESEILRGSWFFRLSAARRHWLTGELDAIEQRERNAPGIALLPSLRRIGTFQREKDAVAYLLGRKRLLDRLASTLRDLLTKNGPRPWPEPPIPGSDLIQPICSEQELVDEGRQLRHCIGTYAEHIAAGVYFVYRMTGPTRCTLGLKWTGYQWALDQLRGGANSRIDEEQTEIVHNWIGAHGAEASVLRSEVAKELHQLIRLPNRERQRRPPPARLLAVTTA